MLSLKEFEKREWTSIGKSRYCCKTQEGEKHHDSCVQRASIVDYRGNSISSGNEERQIITQQPIVIDDIEKRLKDEVRKLEKKYPVSQAPVLQRPAVGRRVIGTEPLFRAYELIHFATPSASGSIQGMTMPDRFRLKRVMCRRELGKWENDDRLVVRTHNKVFLDVKAWMFPNLDFDFGLDDPQVFPGEYLETKFYYSGYNRGENSPYIYVALMGLSYAEIYG